MVSGASAALAALPRRAEVYVERDLGLAWSGSVAVNGSPCARDTLVFPLRDRVTVDGASVRERPPGARAARVAAYHKPSGMRMDEARAAFGDASMEPVGQLDAGTSGLLLFTDDGELNRLVNCPGRLAKTYLAGVDGPAAFELTAAQRDALLRPGTLCANAATRGGARRGKRSGRDAEGVCLEDVRVVASRALPCTREGCAPKHRHTLALTLRSGANHVVKRLLHQRAGLAVRTLHRQSVGGLSLPGGLAPGRAALLGPTEVEALWSDLGGRDEALLRLREAALLCRARRSREERLVAHFGAAVLDDPRRRCFKHFPGLGCVHDDTTLGDRGEAGT